MIHEIGERVAEFLTIPGVPLWVSVAGLSVAMAAVSIVLTAIALVAIPADYFCGTVAPDWSYQRHPVIRWGFRIFRNLFGWFLVFLGIVLLFPGVPGQGALTILLGLMLVEFPGKRRLEQRFVRMPRVHRAVDAIRVRFGAAPLVLDDKDADSDRQ